MARLRRAIPTSAKKSKPRYINAILWSADALRSLSVDILTEMPREENERVYRYPCYETVLGTFYAIRECRVTHGLNLKGKREVFIVIAQYRPDSPVNVALKRLCGAVDWRGSVLVMRAGTNCYVTNMRAGDSAKARGSVRRFLLKMAGALATAQANLTIPTVPLVM